jgi:D-3-phosphoglycerate dehydrogenase
MGRDADALLVQWAPLTRRVMEELKQCRHIVRIGIGVDNVDLEAAAEHGIAVSNVPDYCIDEVADHTLSLALALSRQLMQIDSRVRAGIWKITPDAAMPAFRDMTFITIGFGRIAREVLDRARAFGFRLAAFDPLVPTAAFAERGVDSVTLDEAFAMADVLSLHSPLTPDTRHLVNALRLKTMKPTAVVVNTARGGLIDTVALAAALEEGLIGGVGLDVFEIEPLEADHPIRSSPNTLLTSHVAWYSQASVPQLQRKAAEEIVRGLLGEPLQNRIN